MLNQGFIKIIDKTGKPKTLQTLSNSGGSGNSSNYFPGGW